MRTTAYTTVRPRYGFFDVVGLLFRELWLMIVVFLVVFALGAAAVLTLKKSYTASASVYAGVGQEYVYQPRVGTTERGQPLEADAVAQSEAQILGSLAVKQKTVEVLGADAILGPDAQGTPAEKKTAALKALDQYLVQREAFEQDLARADAAYQAFMTSNNIADFATAKAALAANYQTTFAEALSLRAQLNQATQRLNTLEAQLAQQPAEVVLQQDLNVSAQNQILELRTQREALLSRYTPDAQPVKDIEQQIADLQAYVATGSTVGAKEVRTGPSTIFTTIETARITAAADRDGLAARLAVAEGQLNQLRARLAELTRLESTNANLAGNREVLTANIREFQQREVQARADSALVAAGADNVTVIERAQAPTRGSSLKAPLLAVVFLFAAFTALCVGLLRVFTRRGYVTPASTGRTLDLPVLAVAPMKAP